MISRQNKELSKGSLVKIEYGNGLNSLKTCSGKVPDLTQENSEADLANVLHDMQINDGDFMIEKMRRVKEKIFG